jgi:general secretion pathway protein G
MEAASEESPKRTRRSRLLVGLLVVAVLGIGWALVEIVLPDLFLPPEISQFDEASRDHAKSRLEKIRAAADAFAAANGGKYPDRFEALVTPDASGRTFLGTTEIPTDPWGHPYIYVPPSPGHEEPRFLSYAADGKPGGTGEDADVVSDSASPR